MTTPMAILSLLSILAGCTSICALGIALRTSATSHSKRLNEHSRLISELSGVQEELTLQLRNLRARLNMQAHREKKAADANGQDPAASDTKDSDEKWLRETNLAIAQGRIRPFGR